MATIAEDIVRLVGRDAINMNTLQAPLEIPRDNNAPLSGYYYSAGLNAFVILKYDGLKNLDVSVYRYVEDTQMSDELPDSDIYVSLQKTFEKKHTVSKENFVVTIAVHELMNHGYVKATQVFFPELFIKTDVLRFRLDGIDERVELPFDVEKDGPTVTLTINFKLLYPSSDYAESDSAARNGTPQRPSTSSTETTTSTTTVDEQEEVLQGARDAVEQARTFTTRKKTTVTTQKKVTELI